MAFNKAKAMESALKALNQGKVAQAIQEYQQILRSDPNDQVVLMTVGDLFVRQGNMTQAVEYFERLADRYLHDGFNSKAIAIYKKISKLAPAETQPLEKLANLYVQQGVLSEARPIFLQLAEAHLKSNQTNKAVEVLRRLLEVEPDNPRVQRRLAELYMAIGQKKEAAQTYLAYARYLAEHGEPAEAAKMADAALGAEPGNAAALMLKAKVHGESGDVDAAMNALGKLPDAESNAETLTLQVDLCLKAGKTDRAIELVRQPDAQGNIRFSQVFRLAGTLLESGEADRALDLIAGVREAALAAGEKEPLIHSLTAIAERLKGRAEPLEWLCEIYRNSGDTYQLSETQAQLSDVLTTAGHFDKAESVLKEILEHEPDNELARQRLTQLHKEMGRGTTAPASPGEHAPEISARESITISPTPVALSAADSNLDEETQHFVTQALTDVDLLASYGLTQKATQLLETVLQRVPDHAPTLERLLDISLGSGDDRQTAEFAAKLEQIYAGRGDAVNAERFTELRRRFQRSSGASEEEIAAAPVIAPPGSTPAPAQPRPKPVAPAAAAPPPAEFAIPMAPSEPEPLPPPPPPAPPPARPAEPILAGAPPGVVDQEIDLSDEWEKISAETVAEPEAAPPPPPPAPAAPPAPIAQASAPAAPAAPAEETLEAAIAEFDLELISETSAPGSEAMTSDSFLDQLVAEVEGLEAPVAEKELPAKKKEEVPKPTAKKKEEAKPAAKKEKEAAAPPPPPAPAKVAPPPAPKPKPAVVEAPPPPARVEAPLPPPPPKVEPAIAARSKAAGPAAAPPVSVAAGGSEDLSEVFQEFRDELGEMGEDDEDLETHYNLGIAYREMGLLDEAIGEFQKVAKSIQAGRPFRYAMQCSTLLGVTFMDKQEPKIAALWYGRALETPGLDQETVLALRYDLGVAEEQGGDARAALESFRQVYAMNIDYRDVAEHIAVLQKH
ncbi:MAG TPA: tetratricopeptide repeat protein [Candidatus Acidoferrales bacterium]|nr:tetratricopeptide repeat protein [Candidatus Acidoferrales bacterium]